MKQTIPTGWITLSERLYTALLVLYPADYRHEYGTLMVQLFRDVSREKYQGQGTLGLAFWWCATLFDLTYTALEQRRRIKFTMSKSSFTQMTGMFLIAGGVCGAVAAFSQLQPDDHYRYYGVFQLLIWLLAPSFLLIGLGNIGLAWRIRSTLGALGQWSLFVAGLGALVMAGGAVATQIDASLWNVWYIGGIVHIVGLAGFGLLHVRKPVLPVFRALPLQIAAGLLVLLLGFLRSDSLFLNNALSFLMLFGMGLAWLGIGMKLHRQQQVVMLNAA